MSTPEMNEVLSAAYQYAIDDAKGKDGSHDHFHIQRVFKMATQIAHAEGVKDLEIVQLAALLHDVKDYKYAKDGDCNAGSSIQSLLEKHNYPQERIDLVIKIVDGVGFSKELSQSPADIFPELAVVQDADRLDAIGAIGIGRTFCYGGMKNSRMYDPQCPPRTNLSMDEYRKNESSTVNHFYEKLLLLKDRMKTDTGKMLAKKRHEFMLKFLDQFYDEWGIEPPTTTQQ
eukprot:TRINITY_DN6512_c0_g1_i1.p1 TRINITY_DN6512_c0_g1~~TRINITY_DN6512_c0_g1_i1.p1  ORF type:complete len:241 (+),score=33.85 TRINITY_DN6512_c0_g1_i1:38-724(+)